MLRLAVLGPVRAWRGPDELDLGPPQQRALLALLLVHAGSPVAMSDILDVLWTDHAPPTGPAVVHRYVSRLRKVLDPAATAEPGRAVALLVEALELWSRPGRRRAGAEIRTGPTFAAVDRERTMATLEAAAVALRAGCPARTLPALQSAAATVPLDEQVQAALMLGIAAAGQQAEALGVYGMVRERLAEELAVDPGPELEAAQH